MPTDVEIVAQCFERIAETGTDISPSVYQQFETMAPEASRHISIMDERMRGRMLEQVFKLLMGDTDEDYLKFETSMHKGYGANQMMYQQLFQAVKKSTQLELKDSWGASEDSSWDRIIERILNDIAVTPT